MKVTIDMQISEKNSEEIEVVIKTPKLSEKIESIVEKIYDIGNIIFNLFCTSITLFVFQSNGIELDFIEKYINITEHTFIAYTIIYCIFLMIAFLDMKVKIKKINESIKKRE